MEGVLWFVGTNGWAKADMILALGSLFTKSRETGRRVGVILHIVAAFLFALLYIVVLLAIGMTRFPGALFVSGALGFIHGLVVSLGLVWIIAEQHPLEEFREAGLAVGLSHILGHVIYGAVVGIVVSVSPL